MKAQQDSVIDEINGFINISNYEPLLGDSYIPLPKALDNSMKGLINLKNKVINVLCDVVLDLLILKIEMQKE